jgi:catechol 2,3-dioxygenase-like lactoylglutathione lyase family enzyme
MQLRWSHAVLNVRDIDSMIDFYTKILGFRISDRGPLAGDGSPEIVFMSQVPTDHHQLAFVGAGRDDNPPNSVNHFAFRVESLDDVKEMKAQLDDDGRAQNIRPLTHGNAWSVYFTDP